MTNTTPASSYAQQVQAAINSGDTIGARNLYRSWLAVEPDNCHAMLGLARILPIVDERARFITRVLELEPDNSEALAAHEEIQRWQAQQVKIVSVPRFVHTQPLPEEAPPPPVVEVVMCPNHPAQEATLRCHSCGAPLCVRCAIPNEVGHLCAACRDMRIPDRYRSSFGHQLISAIIGAGIAGLLPLPLSLILGIPFIGPFAFLLGGALAGNVIAQLSERMLQKRGKGIASAASSGIIIGAVMVMWVLGFHTNLLLLMIGILYIFVAIRSVRQSLA
jgi:hypothetical protein